MKREQKKDAVTRLEMTYTAAAVRSLKDDFWINSNLVPDAAPSC